MCEPDPAFARAHSSSTSPASSATSSATTPWPRRRSLRRSEARLRLTRRHQSQRWAGETPSEGWLPARTLTVPPDPRTGRTTGPRSPWTRRVHHSTRRPRSAIPREVVSACWGKAKPEARGTPRTPVRAQAKRRRRRGTPLLLTSLEVRAYPAPRTARPRSPLLRQKRSQGRSCSSIFLQRPTRPRNGGPLSGA